MKFQITKSKFQINLYMAKIYQFGPERPKLKLKQLDKQLDRGLKRSKVGEKTVITKRLSEAIKTQAEAIAAKKHRKWVTEEEIMNKALKRIDKKRNDPLTEKMKRRLPRLLVKGGAQPVAETKPEQFHSSRIEEMKRKMDEDKPDQPFMPSTKEANSESNINPDDLQPPYNLPIAA